MATGAIINSSSQFAQTEPQFAINKHQRNPSMTNNRFAEWRITVCLAAAVALQENNRQLPLNWFRVASNRRRMEIAVNVFSKEDDRALCAQVPLWKASWNRATTTAARMCIQQHTVCCSTIYYRFDRTLRNHRPLGRAIANYSARKLVLANVKQFMHSPKWENHHKLID